MIYLDTSAAAKLSINERETDALETWLDASDGTPVSSLITVIELRRAAARRTAEVQRDVRETLALLGLLPLTVGVADQAAVVGNASLRSLDAIHLATAMLLGDDLTAFVTYDRQLGRAALDAGLTVVAPGYEL